MGKRYIVEKEFEHNGYTCVVTFGSMDIDVAMLEYLSNELAWDSFIFMKENKVCESDKDSAIISKIQKFNPHPTEAITLFFNVNNSTFEEVKIFLIL